MGDTLESVNVERNADGTKLNLTKAKDISRTASKKVVKVTKNVTRKSTGYTKSSINCIAGALPDPEIMILAVMLVTIFVRAEEAHLKKFCDNDGSVGWITTAIGCCVVAFAKYNDTRSTVSSVAACFIYFLIQTSLNYPPLGCLFTNLVVGAADKTGQSIISYSSHTKTFAIAQVFALVVFAVVYTVVIYKKRVANDDDE